MSACIPSCVAFTDDRGCSTYGAERAQSVATGGKWEGPRSGSNRRKSLPSATGCVRAWLVRRGGRRFESVRGSNLPVDAVSPEDADDHFTFLAGFIGADSPASSTYTRELLG
jgi:hypothetical protein